jgi:uncharacterized membrane protein
MMMVNILKYNLLIQTILKALYYFIFFSLLVSFYFFYKELPEKIPMHYDFAGQPTRFGNKTEFLTVVCVLSFLSILFFFLHKYPHKFNYPFKFPEKSRKSIYVLTSVFVLFLSIYLLLINYVVILSAREAALKTNGILNVYGIYGILLGLLVFITTWLYLLKKVANQFEDEK